jgi:hypothetical protein
MNRPLSSASLLCVLALLFVIPHTHSAEYIQSENTAPRSAEEIETPLDAALKKDKKKIRRLLLGELKRRLEKQPAWLRDAELDFNSRSYYLKRVNRDESINEALALGGELAFKTGRFARIARLGLSYYLSYGLYTPEDRGGTGLLGPNQENLAVLGRAYLQLGDLNRFGGRLYRQTLALPYVNKDDGRMIPNTHEAYNLGRLGTGRDFVVGHITKIKKKDSETFIPMSEAAGAPGTDKGVTVTGLKLDLGDDTTFGAFNLYGWDTFNTAYVEGNWVDPLLRRYGLKASVQLTDQRSVGDELVGKFNTNSFGVAVAGSRHGVVLKLAYTQTDEGSGIRSPWGGIPLYNSVMLESFNRAGEKSARLSLSWSDLRGKQAWSGFLNIVTGWDAVDVATGEALSDVMEYDLTVDYKPRAGPARDLWFRLRGAYADFEDGSDRWNVRVILNYPLHLL